MQYSEQPGSRKYTG